MRKVSKMLLFVQYERRRRRWRGFSECKLDDDGAALCTRLSNRAERAQRRFRRTAGVERSVLLQVKSPMTRVFLPVHSLSRRGISVRYNLKKLEKLGVKQFRALEDRKGQKYKIDHDK
ncbi:hypothetical protein CAJAP_09556 [Camponotus japonicus]